MVKRILYWFNNKASIRKKLVLSFSLLVCLPILILGLFSFQTSKKAMEVQIEEMAASNASRLVSEINTRIQKENDYTKYLAYNRTFRKALEIGKGDLIHLAQELTNNVEPVFWYFIASDTYISNINVYSPYINRAIGPFLKPDEPYVEKDWYQSHQKSFNTVWSYEDGRIYATRSILDAGTSSQAIGVLRMEFFESLLSEPIDSMQYINNGILLRDEKGNIIIQKPSGNDHLDALAQNITSSPNKDNIKNQAFFKEESLLASGWTLQYYIDKAMVSKQLAPIVVSTVFTIAICLLVALILITLLSKAISIRLMNLKTMAEKVAQGNFTAAKATPATDEIGVVANSFSAMSKQIQAMIDQIYLIEAEKKNMELKALQAMINPHFLYNCLSSIKWKAIYNNDEEIGKIAGLVATFYRTSLNNGQQLTTVRSELENISAYIEIQQIMHDHSFDVEVQTQDEDLDLLMLNFILQPIVENAVLHGMNYITDKDPRGKILIRFFTSKEQIVFEVLNNGPLMTKDQMDKVLRKPGKGYGIFNIQQRIDLFYGKNSLVEVENIDSRYTCFRVRINKIKE